MSDKLQWPETVDQAVGVLLGLLPDGEKDKIAAMSQDDLVVLHLGLGMWIRNNLGLWSENSALLESARSQNPDDASVVIIEALWRRLREATPKVH
ncbi:DUF6794 domain-containing protein [Accumulibacter sp.]|uniref:DUF6794 domain-containing protein n=1 Tax=Accumulibacter sp. TaxID=2053492 RepID=UPI0035B03847